jgi:metallo-beta-lactamase class B
MLTNHPLFDDFTGKLEKLKSRKAGEPNPFVVGEANHPKFLDVMSACMKAKYRPPQGVNSAGGGKSTN